MQGAWLLMVDSDSAPDGEIWLVAAPTTLTQPSQGMPAPAASAQHAASAADRARPVQVLIPGRAGNQILDFCVVGGTYLVITVLQDMAVRVELYRLSAPTSDVLQPWTQYSATLHWTYSPGPSISALGVVQGAWPPEVPLVRVSYSNLTTPMTTVDLDVSSRTARINHVSICALSLTMAPVAVPLHP